MRFLVVCLLVVACADPPPDSDLPEVTSRVGYFEIPYGGRSKLDLLFIVDDSTAMAPYRAEVVAQVPQFADELAMVYGGIPDLNIAVVSADSAAGGTFRTSPSVDGPFVIDGMRDGERVTNYTGELRDALAQLVDVGAASSAPSRPLDVLPLALAQNAFMRDNAYLAIVVISATDDASSAVVATLVSQLKNMKTDPTNVILIGIYQRPAPRLDDFMSQFPNRNTYTALDAADIGAGFSSILQLNRTVLGVPCFEWDPVDVDPETPGDQYDCVIEHEDWATKETTLLRRCGAGDVFPCWDMRRDPQVCMTTPSIRFSIEHGYEGLPYEGALVSGQCLVQ